MTNTTKTTGKSVSQKNNTATVEDAPQQQQKQGATFANVGRVCRSQNQKQIVGFVNFPITFSIPRTTEGFENGIPVSARIGENDWQEIGTARLSKSGNAINIFAFGGMVTIPKGRFDDLVNDANNVRLVSVSAPSDKVYVSTYTKDNGGQ